MEFSPRAAIRSLRWNLAPITPFQFGREKPYNRRRLKAADPQLVIPRRSIMAKTSTTSVAPAAPARKSRILIADDNAPNVELLEAFLADLDCDIAVAVDGKDTLDKVASFKPDLILLDVMMPKLSGFEVCRSLKENPKTRGIMVLMVTALNELGDIERAVNSGTDDFISKPVNKLELLKRVENMLKVLNLTDELERLRRYIQGMEDDTGPQ